MNPSTALGRVVVETLHAYGVREVVLAPGSRSAPLALAALAHPDVRVHVRIDERTAGFLALGLAKASGEPVAVATTSGTATANLHPAVLEADHAGVPLVVLTADRPPELRGVGANQTTDQVGLYAGAVRWFAELGPVGQPGYWRDVVARAVIAATGVRSNDPGPVHLNVAFAEPLLPDGEDGAPDPPDGGQRLRVAGGPRPEPVELALGPRTVVLAGDGAGSGARELAETAGWPLLAEPSSGARGGPNAVGPYRLLLEAEGLGAAIERVVLLGNATLSRPVTRLLERDDVDLVVVSPRPRWPDPARRASLVAGAISAAPEPDDAWLTRWQRAAAAAEEALDAALGATGVTGPAVARALGAAAPALVVSGSSSAIRDLDLALRPDADPLRVLANRGLSGIDGTVSTAVGAALATGVPTVGLLGDLALLHDATGLVLGPHEPRPDLALVVLNDDGGGLFHLLEQGQPAYAEAFERVFGTSHGVDLAALAAATGVGYARAESAAEAAAYATEARGLTLVEVRIDRVGRRSLHERLREAVLAAVRE